LITNQRAALEKRPNKVVRAPCRIIAKSVAPTSAIADEYLWFELQQKGQDQTI
jgi:hypothetical protein